MKESDRQISGKCMTKVKRDKKESKKKNKNKRKEWGDERNQAGKEDQEDQRWG